MLRSHFIDFEENIDLVKNRDIQQSSRERFGLANRKDD